MSDRLSLLTARELELARLVARGLCNKLIAREVGITDGTVKFYLHRIYQKLGVAGRTQLAVLIVTTRDEAA